MKKSNYVVSESSTIRDGLEKIKLNSIGMVFVVDKNDKVIGVATDGDIRSSLLDKASLLDSIKKCFNPDFIWSKNSDSRESILKLLDSKIKAVPILDKNMELVDVITSSRFPIVIEKDIYARSKAPVRISFAGGGSDLTHYFMDDGGAVLNASISLYSHATLRPRRDFKIRISSLDLGETNEYENLDSMLISRDNFGLFRSLLQLIRPDFGFDLSINSDFPFGSGLGGSSSVMIAICGCFNELRKDRWSDHELAEIAFQAERISMNISGGWQDQYATVFGGLNFIEFKNDNNLISPLRLRDKSVFELEECLYLFEVTSGRNSGDIHDDQESTMRDPKIQELVRKNVSHCYSMRDYLLRGKLTEFGEGLNLAWSMKRQFSKKISNDLIDEMYNFALKSGASGGKLLGAGGGGFFLFFVQHSKKNDFLLAMKENGHEETRFNFDQSGMQSWTSRETYD